MAGVGNLGKISWADVYKSNAFGENLVESRKVIGLAVGKGQKKKKDKINLYIQLQAELPTGSRQLTSCVK